MCFISFPEAKLVDIEGTKLCLQNVNPIKKVGLKNKYIRVDLNGSKNESILKVGKVGKNP